MKHIFCLLLICTAFLSNAQTAFQYAAAKTGLSLRESAASNSKVLQKINYGEKVEIVEDTATPQKIITEGFEGFWRKIKYKNQVGYVVSSYLFPVQPPKPTVKSVQQYLAQLSTVAGAKVVVKKGSMENMGDSYYNLEKQLYKNGAEWHAYNAYEFNSETFYLPEFSIEQAFLLIRIIGVYNIEVGPQDPYPTKNTTTKLEFSDRKTTIERIIWDTGNIEGPIKKITIETAEGGYTTLEIYLVDGQAVICWGSGV
jgi:Bacterial SH3 domain